VLVPEVGSIIDNPSSAFHDQGMIKSLFLFLCLSLSASLYADALEDLQAFIEESKTSGAINMEKEGWRTRLPKFPDVAFAEDVTYEWVLETSEGTLVAELNEEAAPEHVRNILYLSSLGYYDGLTFHRIIPGFMAQGGCPLGRGTGGPGYQVNLEVKPGVKHDSAGVLSMARSQNPNSAGSQFFLTFTETPFLDGGYTVFGKVIEGLDVLKKLEAAGNPDPRANGVPPTKTITILSATVRKAAADPAS
jgi:cyclophilin family peptidyl-prolyl cis-trans isomerase